MNTIDAKGANLVNFNAVKMYFVFPNNTNAPVPARLIQLPKLRFGGGVGGGGVGRRELLLFWCDDEKYASDDEGRRLLLDAGRRLRLPGSRVGNGSEDKQGDNSIVVVVVG